MDSLIVAIPVFLASAIVVVLAGIALAKYGDDLAVVTGWGALWVGTILVSVATSLPELITNISAVILVNPPAPGLALGNVFGADMINIFTISLVALSFGIGNIFGNQTRDTQTLIVAAIVLGIISISFGFLGDWGLGPTSVGAIVITGAYFLGMKLVYDAGRGNEEDELGVDSSDKSKMRAWIGFGAAGFVVLIAAPLLALSADGIAEASGLGRSFIGVLLVSIVTTLPEASVTVAAALRKSYALVIGNIYGSCAFNLFVIPIAGLFYTGGPILHEMDNSHFVAAGSAIALMTAGFLIVMSFKIKSIAWLKYLTFAIPPAYIGSLALVYNLSSV
tara:strand:+ start:5938 stop:6939 length:1002 start_codon:yes stop_codon:yes gene_type:complete